MEILAVAAAGPAVLGPGEADFSFYALFLRADIIVKAVMVGLFLASIWSWAIVIEKQCPEPDIGESAVKVSQQEPLGAVVFIAETRCLAGLDELSGHSPSGFDPSSQSAHRYPITKLLDGL